MGSSSEVEERIFFGVVESTRWLQRLGLLVGVDRSDGLGWVDVLIGEEVDVNGLLYEMSRTRSARQRFLTTYPKTLVVTQTHDPIFGTGVFSKRLSFAKKQTTENSAGFEGLEGSYTEVRSSKLRRLG